MFTSVGVCVYVCVCVCVYAQSCPSLCNPHSSLSQEDMYNIVLFFLFFFFAFHEYKRKN